MHIGLIADGNRRWAKSCGKNIIEGHRAGFDKIRSAILPTLQKNPEVRSLTIYSFSTENWKRDIFEIKNLMTLFYEMSQQWQKELVTQNIRLIHVGSKQKIPQKLAQKLTELEQETRDGDFTIYLCLDYGGKDDITQKVKNFRENFHENFEIPNLDIVIRTGGEQRISNFCLWQIAYAELFFLQKFLPEVENEDIQNILNLFKQRQRREGQ